MGNYDENKPENQIDSLLTRLMEPFYSIEYDQATRFSRSHLWFQPMNDNHGWRSGLDSFAVMVLGQITEIIFPILQDSLPLGNNLCWLNHIDGMLVIKSPVDAKNLTVNPRVIDHPSLMLSDPMGDGWLVEGEFDLFANSPYIAPASDIGKWVEQEIIWLQAEIESALRARMVPQVGATLADGGVYVADICAALGPVAHRDILRRIMNL